ncbi:MAG TPA: hypothetical protein ENN80_15355 [Candidatus Hydrogenedentes bacterium]|nr:hypothetical protein [Candidatus Hydrogenedentota bacterium]
MRRCLAGILLVAISGLAAGQQGVVGDVLSGRLVKPKVGQWAWYEMEDAETNRRYALRQAIVGEEWVGWKKGYWLELEVVPPVGYRSVYKMLVTGPASDPRNVHRLLVRDGLSEPVEAPVGQEEGGQSKTPAIKRESMGVETVTTSAGEIKAEHLRLTSGGAASDMWVNDAVRPLGIVRMMSQDGELMLLKYGEGGRDARSVIDEDPLEGRAPPEPKVEVRVESGEMSESHTSARPDARAGPESVSEER